MLAVALFAIAPTDVAPVLPPAVPATAELAARGGHAHAAVDPSRGARAVIILGYEADLERLGVKRVRDLERFEAWVCIHNHEAAWNDAGDPYWGGLQMDRGFMLAYGRDMIARHHGGLADTWTEAEQIIVAERAYETRGFGPWPNTRRPCGV